jgi:hypothetical protein
MHMLLDDVHVGSINISRSIFYMLQFHFNRKLATLEAKECLNWDAPRIAVRFGTLVKVGKVLLKGLLQREWANGVMTIWQCASPTINNWDQNEGRDGIKRDIGFVEGSAIF